MVIKGIKEFLGMTEKSSQKTFVQDYQDFIYGYIVSYVLKNKRWPDIKYDKKLKDSERCVKDVMRRCLLKIINDFKVGAFDKVNILFFECFLDLVSPNKHHWDGDIYIGFSSDFNEALFFYAKKFPKNKIVFFDDVDDVEIENLCLEYVRNKTMRIE
jgi:hypothetical protein